jgi:hypothetical protein
VDSSNLLSIGLLARFYYLQGESQILFAVNLVEALDKVQSLAGVNWYSLSSKAKQSENFSEFGGGDSILVCRRT